jgi:hypothetical protein
MPHPIEPSTLRILNPNGKTVGTGFLVARNLAVTCAHVITDAESIEGDTIQVQFTGRNEKINARVLPEFWSGASKFDVAILQIDEVPSGVFPLRMGRASESQLKNDLYSFGYAIAADEQGIGGLGTFITLKQEGNLIQFRMHEANHGHSGAPIYDDKRGVVVGMIAKGHSGTGRNAETTFATPTETIWQVCPQLKPPTPVLPRRNPIVEGINLLPYDYDQRIQNFLTEYLGSDQHPVPFGGRDEALHMLEAWLAETTPYLLLAAPAGRGKSALLVRWLDSLKAREDLALAFVPVSIRFGTNMERVFYAALAARLAHLHGNDIPASPETSTAVYRGLVSDYLSKPLANGRTLLVVLDGLDEAADWQAGADFMPSELPTGVRVVVSARFLAGDADSIPWLCRLNWERNGLASAPSLFPLDRAGVADVLLKMGCPLDELSRKVDIVAELFRLSAGDPLLVGLYVGDLWSKGAKVSLLKLEDLAGIQPGYKGYFDRWWNDQKKLWGKDKPWLERHVRAVRNLLAGAIGALFLADFHTLDPKLESDYIADALDVLQRFIIGDNQTQGYTFSHPKLGQYFWDALTPTEQVQVEVHFLDWGEQTLQEFIEGKRDPRKKAEVPVYVMRNYTAHLARAQQPIEKWLPLIHNQQWAQAWFTVEGDYGGYLQDVRRVWERCKLFDRRSVDRISKAPYLGVHIRCALVEASLHSLMENIPSKLVVLLVKNNLWTLPQTWVFIRQMPDSYQQARTIIALLPHLTNRQVKEAYDAARAIQYAGARAEVLGALVQRLPEVTREALETLLAREIENDRERAWALSLLASHAPEEYLMSILEMTRALKLEEARVQVLSILAQRMPEVMGEAFEVMRAIKNEDERARCLCDLANGMSNGQLVEMLKEVRKITAEMPRSWVLTALARDIPKENLEQVFEMARAMKNENRVYVLANLVRRLPEVTREAIEAVQAIQNVMTHANALSDLAQNMPEENLAPILESARKIKRVEDRANVLSILAPRMPEVMMEALETIRAIQDKGKRADVLVNLAQHWPKVTEEALEAACAINDELDRVKLLSSLAQRLPEATGDAIEAALAVKNERKRGTALNYLARYLPQENLRQVLELARAVVNENNRAETLVALAQRLPELTGEAIEAVQAIQFELQRENVLSDLVRHLRKEELVHAFEMARAFKYGISGNLLETLAQHLPEECLGQVLEMALTIKREEDRVRALNALAQRLPKECLGQVLEIARTIENEGNRTKLLVILAQRMPKVVIEALDAARAMQNQINRANALVALAQILPELTGEATDAARAINNKKKRAQALSNLAKYLPEITREALEATRAIDNKGGSRAIILKDLAQRIPEVAVEALDAGLEIESGAIRYWLLSILAHQIRNIRVEECYSSLETAISTLSHRTRSNFFSDISALLPLLIMCGSEEIDREILQAVQDVSKWWN